MRIRNNKEFNIKVLADHAGAGAGAPGYITIPAGATLELTDAEWKPFANPAKNDLACGNLEITKAPAKSEEEVEAERVAGIAAAEKLLADNKVAEAAKAEAEKKAKAETAKAN